jgi:hypothetical protein
VLGLDWDESRGPLARAYTREMAGVWCFYNTLTAGQTTTIEQN